MNQNHSEENQLLFDFCAAASPAPDAEAGDAPEKSVPPEVEPGSEPESKIATQALSLQKMRQAVLAFLARQNPCGLALHVPTRLKKFQVDVAAYFSAPVRRFNQISHTVVVDLYLDRELCLPECAEQATLLAEFKAIKLRRNELEAVIRASEPELRDRDELFAEFQHYNYSQSRNVEYQQLMRRFEKVHHALFRGSRMEQIRRAAVADYLYMAVPRDLISPDELVDGWGLLYLDADGTVELVRDAQFQQCSEAARLHLAQNIGRAALQSVLFANGISLADGGDSVRFTRPPRRRRK